jgi:hypothetical protein
MGLRMKLKHKAKLLIATVMLAMISYGVYYGWMSLPIHRSSYFWRTPTTDLSNENIWGLSLFQSIDNKEFKEKFGRYMKQEENKYIEVYEISHYDTGSHSAQIVVNKKKQIVSIIYFGVAKTTKEIGIGNSIEDVIKVYGNNYYKRVTDQGVSVIGYVDQKEHTTIEFGYHPKRNTVDNIRIDIASMGLL